jgi:hypothetical protein
MQQIFIDTVAQEAQMANNITIRAVKPISIVAIEKYKSGELTIQSGAGSFKKPAAPANEYSITHKITFPDSKYSSCLDMIYNPNSDIGIMLWFGAASGIGRPSHSKALFHGDNLYYFLSWTDILGSGHGKQNDPRRLVNGRLVQFLAKAKKQECQKIMELIKPMI